MNSSFPVVGIGASAGGLHALELFFGAMPPYPGMAFVVVTHLAPDRKSLLTEILARHTTLPVVTAADGQELERDKVYVMPPSETLTMSEGRCASTSFRATSTSGPRSTFSSLHWRRIAANMPSESCSRAAAPMACSASRRSRKAAA